MFVEFFLALKEAQIPVTLREYLVLLEAMERKVVSFNVDDFYFLSRSSLVKDERNLDKFVPIKNYLYKIPNFFDKFTYDSL